MKLGPSRRIPGSNCLSCGRLLDCASVLDNPNKKKPKPGDFTICIDCGHVMGFAPTCRCVN